jgi:hypothetical protein
MSSNAEFGFRSAELIHFGLKKEICVGCKSVWSGVQTLATYNFVDC